MTRHSELSNIDCSGCKNTILIIDDNPANLGVMVEYLSDYGFEIMTALDGKSGIKRANYARPDLILLDVRMPGLNGFETCRRLRADEATCHIPVIFMTALTDMEDKVKGFQMGAVDYVTKPVQYEEVLARINTHLTLCNLQQELRATNFDLERRVADRTHRLQVRTALSTKLNEISDLDKLLQILSNQLRDSFNYHYVQVYLVEAQTNHLVLAKGTGDIGQRMQAEQRHLPPGQGLVGLAVQNHEYVLCNNVAECSQFVQHRLLPDTQSEIALPLHLGDELIGVLNIHSNLINAFQEGDVSMLKSIADEAAVAINNARLLAKQRATILKLQELDQAKSRFLGLVSHELRTPMNSVLGHTDMLLEGIYGTLTEPVHKGVMSICKSAEQMMALISDLLDITQMEAGEFQINLEPVSDIPDLIEEVIHTLKPLTLGKPVELLADISSDLPMLQADRGRLYQILINLGNNALKFTQSGSVIIVANRHERQPNYLRFAVIDTGIGISIDKQAEIFEPFKLVDMTYTRQHNGLGLGLAICRQLVQLHGGEIWVKSESDVGSAFYFTIPLADL